MPHGKIMAVGRPAAGGRFVEEGEIKMGNNVIVVNPADNVAVAIEAIKAGERISGLGATLVAATDVPRNHKVAIGAIAEGEEVIKYGESIGTATAAIRAGEWVHTHNLRMGEGNN
jgi:predicted RecA/RadA family phage recombinase